MSAIPNTNSKPIPYTNFISFRPGVLTPSECQEIIDWFEKKDDWQKAKVYNDRGPKQNSDSRSGFTCWDYEEATPHLWKIKNQILDYNENQHYNLSGKFEIQMAKYDIGGHFDKHQDTHVNLSHYQAYHSNGKTRKISSTFQLSDPNSYEGGELMITTKKDTEGSTGIAAPKEQGTQIIFPSFVDHKVKPVTNGLRYAIVIWALGPWWK